MPRQVTPSQGARDARSGQLGFDALLAEAALDNQARRIAQATAHLPDRMDQGLPVFRDLLISHHAAMMAGDTAETMRLRAEAGRLARRLNKNAPGILAGPQAPGRVLIRETAAVAGSTPLWGQAGDFIIEIAGMRVRIAQNAMLGVGSSVYFWLGFDAHAVELDAPFISPTGAMADFG